MNVAEAILTALIKSALFVGTAFLGNLVSEEIRGRLDYLPDGLIRLAASCLPTDIRDEFAEEWKAELHAILRDREGLPITRLCCGTRFALGLLRSAPSIAASLGPSLLDSLARDIGQIQTILNILSRSAGSDLGSIGTFGDPWRVSLTPWRAAAGNEVWVRVKVWCGETLEGAKEFRLEDISPKLPSFLQQVESYRGEQ